MNSVLRLRRNLSYIARLDKNLSQTKNFGHVRNERLVTLDDLRQDVFVTSHRAIATRMVTGRTLSPCLFDWTFVRDHNQTEFEEIGVPIQTHHATDRMHAACLFPVPYLEGSHMSKSRECTTRTFPADHSHF